MEETLKERFEAILDQKGVRIFGAQQARIIEAMHQALQLAEGDKWISVEDRLPSDVEASQDLLVVNDGLRMTAEFMKGQWWFDWTNEFLTKVTHWMPLPAPPNPKD